MVFWQVKPVWMVFTLLFLTSLLIAVFLIANNVISQPDIFNILGEIYELGGEEGVEELLLPETVTYDPDIEIISEDYSPTFAKTCYSDGKCIATLYSGVMFYSNGSNYVPINTTWIPYNQGGYDYVMNRSDYTIYAKANSNWGDGIKYCVNHSGSQQCLIYQSSDYSYRDIYGSQDYISSITNVQGRLLGNGISYDNTYPDVNLTFNTYNEKMKENYVINTKPRNPANYLVNPTLDFGGYIKYGNLSLYVDNVNVTGQDFVTNSSMEFRYNDKILFYLPAPYAKDSNITRANIIQSKPNLQYEVKNQQSAIWFYVKTPYAWLNDSARIYPVYIDPTVQLITKGTENLENSTIYFDAPTAVFYDERLDLQIEIGKNVFAAFSKYNITDITGEGRIVTNATFCAVAEEVYGGGFTSINLYHISNNQTWTHRAITWNSNPCKLGQCNMTAQSTRASPADEAQQCFELTQGVALDVAAGNTNTSFFLNTSDAATAVKDTYFHGSNSLTAAKRPYLNITYSELLPVYSLNSTNSTLAGSDIKHSLNWTKGSNALSGYIFSFHNGANWTDETCSNYNSSESSCKAFGCSWNATVPSLSIPVKAAAFSAASSGTINNVNLPMISSNSSLIPFIAGGTSADALYTTEVNVINSTAFNWAMFDDGDAAESIAGSYVTFANGTYALNSTNNMECIYVSSVAGASDGTITLKTNYTTTGFAAVVLPRTDDDGVRINTGTKGATTFAWTAKDDAGAFEPILTGFYYCIIPYGSTSNNGVTIQAGTNTLGSTATTEKFIPLPTAMPNNSYTVITTAFLAVSTDHCALEIGTKNTTHFGITGEDDDTTNSCTGRGFDYIVVPYTNSMINYVPEIPSNCTGTSNYELKNDTWTPFTTSWSNVTKTVNSTTNSLIKWCVYANDSRNNWNGTSCTTPFAYYTTTVTITDATFSVALPSEYDWDSITGDTEGGATATVLMSFNFTSLPQTQAQPFAEGLSAKPQQGTMLPILYVDPTGTAATDFDLKLSANPPAGITIKANVSCAGTNGTCSPALVTLTTSYQNFVDELSQTSSYANITLFADLAAGTAPTVASDIILYVKGYID